MVEARYSCPHRHVFIVAGSCGPHWQCRLPPCYLRRGRAPGIQLASTEHHRPRAGVVVIGSARGLLFALPPPPPSRHPSSWLGVGIACGFIGGALPGSGIIMVVIDAACIVVVTWVARGSRFVWGSTPSDTVVVVVAGIVSPECIWHGWLARAMRVRSGERRPSLHTASHRWGLDIRDNQ